MGCERGNYEFTTFQMSVCNTGNLNPIFEGGGGNQKRNCMGEFVDDEFGQGVICFLLSIQLYSFRKMHKFFP